MKVKESVERHRKQSLHCLENAFKSIKAGDAEKAGEFLWGSMAQALKTVAASKEKKLKRHSDLGKFARALTKEQNDREIYNTYQRASYLHSNYYEVDLSLEEVALSAYDIKEMINKLLELVPDE